MITVELSRANNDYGFEVKDAYGNMVRTDTSPETGGENFGARPMQLLLMALGSCSGIDVVSILKKQKQDVTDYKMKISGERQAGIEPSLWTKIYVEFHIFGNVDEDKAKRAAELSINKYCSVAATLKAAGAIIEHNVFVHKTA
jgi:putative redox protein